MVAPQPLFQQQFGWTFSHGRRGERVLVEVLAKLLEPIKGPWATLLSGGPLDGRSPTKPFKEVRRFALRLLDQAGNAEGVGAAA